MVTRWIWLAGNCVLLDTARHKGSWVFYSHRFQFRGDLFRHNLVIRQGACVQERLLDWQDRAFGMKVGGQGVTCPLEEEQTVP